MKVSLNNPLNNKKKKRIINHVQQPEKEEKGEVRVWSLILMPPMG
jgi:hypothetical protein